MTANDNSLRATAVPEAREPREAAPVSIGPWGWTWRAVLALVLVVLYFGGRLLWEVPLAGLYAPRPAIVPGPDTTRIEGPLDSDGFVDFAAALDAEAGQGVTPENNAAIPFFRAVGRSEFSRGEDGLDHCADFFQKLGMEIPALEGDYLTDDTPDLSEPVSPEQAEARRRFEHEGHEAERRPWTREEFPEVAAHVEANSERLDRIVAASRLPRWYVPLIAAKGKQGLSGTLLPHGRPGWWVAMYLSRRAMLRLAAGELDAAWEDGEALARFARLFGQGPHGMDFLLEQAMESKALAVFAAIAADPRLDADRRRKFRERLSSFPPPSEMRTRVDVADRYMYLDHCRLAALAAESSPQIDWNELAREGNRRFDEYVERLQRPNLELRFRAIQTLEVDKIARTTTRKFSSYWINQWFAGESIRTLRGRALQPTIEITDISDVLALIEQEMIWRGKRDLAELTFALAEFRAATGNYPEQLDELVPKYVAALPTNPFAPIPAPDYERTAEGYRLAFSDHESPGVQFVVPVEKRPYDRPVSPGSIGPDGQPLDPMESNVPEKGE